MDNKKCRVCNRTNVHFSPSRILKKDYICCECANEQKRKWGAQYKKAKATLKKYTDYYATFEAKIASQIKFLGMLDNEPICPFCEVSMTPNRRGHNKGKRLIWECKPCNDIIEVQEI